MATNQNQYPANSYGIGGLYLEFSFQANGAASPLLSTVTKQMLPQVKSLTRTATGVIAVVLTYPYFECIYKSADTDDSAGDGGYVTVGNFVAGSGQSGSTFNLRCFAASGTAADFTAGRIINACFRFRNSTGQ